MSNTTGLGTGPSVAAPRWSPTCRGRRSDVGSPSGCPDLAPPSTQHAGNIARRLGRSHESVRLYSRNRRGPGNFPAPVGKIDDKTAVWDWGDIAQWWEQTHGEPVSGTADSAFLTIVNCALEMRRAAARLAGGPEEEFAAVADLLPSEVKRSANRASAQNAVAV